MFCWEHRFAGHFPGERVLWSYNEHPLAPISQLNWTWVEVSMRAAVYGDVSECVSQLDLP